MLASISISAIPKPRHAFHPGLAVAFVFVTGAALVIKIPALLVFPCPWKYFLKIPCPTCGAGRCVQALLDLRIADAFLYNPMIFLGIFIGAFVAFAWMMQILFGVRLQIDSEKQKTLNFRFLAILFLLLNYAYLLQFQL
jgi:hypothetical protein